MTFWTRLELHGKTATGLNVPAAYVADLGGGARPAVVVTLNKTYSYRSTVAPYAGQALLPVAALHREAAGLHAGDLVEVTLVLDTAPRTVEIPDDLAQALGEAHRLDAFEAQAPSAKKAQVTLVTDAKAPETRARRIAKILADLA